MSQDIPARILFPETGSELQPCPANSDDKTLLPRNKRHAVSQSPQWQNRTHIQQRHLQGARRALVSLSSDRQGLPRERQVRDRQKESSICGDRIVDGVRAKETSGFRLGGGGEKKMVRVEVKYIYHWKPLKDKEGAVKWAVLTIAQRRLLENVGKFRSVLS